MEESRLIEMYGMVMETGANVKNLVGRFDVLEEEHRQRGNERACGIYEHEKKYHATPKESKQTALDIVGKIAQWGGVLAAIFIAVFRK